MSHLRIAVGSSYGYWGDFTPHDIFEKTDLDVQVGGGETAMLQISTELARRGHDVTVFYNTKPGRYYDVDYLPMDMFIGEVCYREYDALIVWDAPYLLRYCDKARVHVQAFQLNDVVLGVMDWVTDLYMHPSQWHADRFHSMYAELTPEKQRPYLTNGIDYTRYFNVDDHGNPIINLKKVPGRVVYSSSPDRGLHHLLRIWPEVATRVPGAELHVFYDMNKWLGVVADAAKDGVNLITGDRAALLRSQIQNLPPSVHLHGGIGQRRLAEEQLQAHVLAYPCDPVRPTEGFSMTVLEGITAGCHVLTTDADAFPELWSKALGVTMLPLPIDDNAWINNLVDLLRAEPAKVRYSPRYAWATLASAWERELYLCLKNKP